MEGGLAALGDWPGITIDRQSHRIIQRAYDQVITACARLASFSTSTGVTFGPVNERQDTLAADDLIRFAIHARRLIENTARKRRFGQVSIPSKGKSGPSQLRLLAIIGVLIHHDYIEVVRSAAKMVALSGKHCEIDELMELVYRTFPPIVVAKSEAGRTVAFELKDLIETFQLRILEPIVELCEEHEFYLEDF